MPATPENQQKIIAHIMGLLKTPDTIFHLGKSDSRPLNEIFMYGQKQRSGDRKTPVVAPTLYIDPAAEDYLYEAAKLVEVLPPEKNHWLSPTDACAHLGISIKPKTINAFRQVLLDQLEDEADRTIKGYGIVSNGVGCYSNSGPKGINPYSDPAYLDANKDELTSRVKRTLDPDYFMLAQADLRTIIHMSGQRQRPAVEGVLNAMREQKRGQTINVPADDVTPETTMLAEQAIRPVSYHGGPPSTQIDRRVVPQFQEEIIARMKRATEPDFFMAAPLEVTRALGVGDVERDRVTGILETLAQERGTAPVALTPDPYVNETSMPTNQAIRMVSNRGRELLQIDRRAIPALLEEIRARLQTIRTPVEQTWLPPVEVHRAVKPQLTRRVQQRDMVQVLKRVLEADGDRTIAIGGTERKISDVIHKARGTIVVQPEALPALVPRFNEAIEFLKMNPPRRQ